MGKSDAATKDVSREDVIASLSQYRDECRELSQYRDEFREVPSWHDFRRHRERTDARASSPLTLWSTDASSSPSDPRAFSSPEWQREHAAAGEHLSVDGGPGFRRVRDPRPSDRLSPIAARALSHRACSDEGGVTKQVGVSSLCGLPI